MLTIHLLGRFEILLDGQPFSLPSRPAQSLLAYLLLHLGAHRREKLAGVLWPDVGEENARNSLRHALWQLRQALPAGAMQADRIAIAWAAGADCVLDVERLRRLPAQSTGDDLAAAVAVYTGDLLPGFYDEWIGLERERLRAVYAEGMKRLLTVLVAEARWREAIEWAERWIAQGESPEPAYRALMVAHAGLGDLAAAAAAYRRCVHALQADLDAPPSAETTALYEAIREGRGAGGEEQMADDDTHHAPRTTHNNLPSQPTRFIGRQAELLRITQSLRSPNVRLVTVLGAGGVGKSRLAMEAAGQTLDEFPDGVWLVPLTAVQEPGRLASTILETLNLPANAEDLVASLGQHLRQKRLLLLLDNFEQLLPAAPDLARVLGTAPSIKVLVTSRERLNLQEEWLYPLQGLEFPPDQGDAAQAQRYSALDLFVERMQQVRPDFSLTLTHWKPVARICRLVDGLPLGIELAAGWGELLSCQEIADEIGGSLDFLQSDRRNLSDRHRSMRAVFDHSWRLLSADEQAALRKLSIFRAGFEREAAQIVAAPSLPLLLGLVRKSLVRRGEDGRFDLHELLRQFAAEKLAQAQEVERVEAAHAAYYLSFLRDQFDYTKVHFSEDALRTVSREIENIRQAWHWAVDHLALDLLAPATSALHRFTSQKDWLQQARAVFQTALDRLEEAWPQARLAAVDGEIRFHLLTLWGKLLFYKAWFSFRHHRLQEAIGPVRQGIAFLRQAGHTDSIDLVNGLDTMGHLLTEVENYTEAAVYVEEAVAIVERMGYRQWMGSLLERQGAIATGLGSYQEARRLLLRGVELAEAYDLPLVGGFCQRRLAIAEAILGNFEAAKLANQQARAAAEAVGNRFLKLHTAATALWLHLLSESPHSADPLAEQLERDIDDYREAGGDPQFVDRDIASFYRHTGQFEKAHELLMKDQQLWQSQGDRMRAYIDLGPTLLLLDMVETERARERADEALSIFTARQDRPGIAFAHTLLAACDVESGYANRDETLDRLQQALAWTHQVANLPMTLHILYLLGKLLAADNSAQQSQAVELLTWIIPHRSTLWEIKVKAQRELSILENQLSADIVEAARQRGSSLTIDDAIALLQSSRPDCHVGET